MTWDKTRKIRYSTGAMLGGVVVVCRGGGVLWLCVGEGGCCGCV